MSAQKFHRPFTASKSIQLFMHCAKCLHQRLPQRLEVGWTEQGLQVWCKNHECNVVHIDFEGHQHPAITTAEDTI